ncbi:MAG: hypothetical protein II308_06690, partial [Muribaculaceae bacterium]|nr:hypothetical protein [Muribaculaceae bacterium]
RKLKKLKRLLATTGKKAATSNLSKRYNQRKRWMSARIIRLFSFKQSPINCFAVLVYAPIYIGRGTLRTLRKWDTSRKEDTLNVGHLGYRG